MLWRLSRQPELDTGLTKEQYEAARASGAISPDGYSIAPAGTQQAPPPEPQATPGPTDAASPPVKGVTDGMVNSSG